jgi:hypothetical protein
MKQPTQFARRAGIISVIVFLQLSFLGFCILTNSAGQYRRYLDSDIPFVYRLNSSVPAEYIPAIEAGHREWNDITSCYWIFERGNTTSVSAAVQDGINLLFFDIQGVNFASGTSTIAFSRTFTSSAGGIYHALESDLVWNARDFPPSPTGQPGRQDLQSVIAHEFGHHLGLGHQGTPGSPPGCGPSIQAAVMYGTSSAGDTTNRHLHIHDIAGASSIYPVWRLQGTITSSATSQPIASAHVRYVGTLATGIGSVETPNGTTFERAGLPLEEDFTDNNGNFSNVVLDQSFQLIVSSFGSISDTATISFNPPGGIGQTQDITHNVALQMAPLASVSGTIRDERTLAGIVARVEFYGSTDPSGLTLALQSQSDGSYAAMLPSMVSYTVVVRPPAPYADTVRIAQVQLTPSGFIANFDLPEAEVLLVDDDAGDQLEGYYQAALDRTGMTRRTFGIADSASLPSTVLSVFTQRPVLFWMTGEDSTDALTQSERLVILDHLASGGNAIISGSNIAQFSPPGDSLLVHTFGITYAGDAPQLFVKGFGGDPIGDGINYPFSAGAVPNSTAKDKFVLSEGSIGDVTKSMHYRFPGTDTTALAGARIVGPGASWAATFYAFGLEALDPARFDTILVRSVRYVNQSVTGVESHAANTVPTDYLLEQNYPNPFNPVTQIRYGLPQQGHVTLTVHDIAGRVVRNLLDREQRAGIYLIEWDGRNNRGQSVSTGIYFYTMESNAADGARFSLSRKMVLVK